MKTRKSGAGRFVCALRLSALITASVLTPVCSIAAIPTYSLTRVGFSGDFSETHATGINDSGGVSGYTETPGAHRAFYWTAASGAIELPTPPGTGLAQAMGLNDPGQLVGRTIDGSTFAYHPILWSPIGSTYSVADLGNIDAPYLPENGATAINSNGSAIGQTYAFGDHGYLWTPSTPNNTTGTLTSLGGGSGSDLSPRAISASGTIAGLTSGSSFGVAQAFIWIPTTPNGTVGTMHTPGGLETGTVGASYINGMNELGQLVGGWHLTSRAILWDPDGSDGYTGHATELGLLPGVDPNLPTSTSAASDINNLGVVVGASRASDKLMHAFVWTADAGMLDLNDLVDASAAGWLLNSAAAINDSGWIVGVGTFDPDGPGGLPASTQSFLLRPIPEPATVVLGSGSLFLIIRRRKGRSADTGRGTRSAPSSRQRFEAIANPAIS